MARSQLKAERRAAPAVSGRIPSQQGQRTMNSSAPLFSSGDTVIVQSDRAGGTSYAKAVVAKILKSGNIVLDGSPQQYRIATDWAVQTGDHFYKDFVYPATPERLAQMEASKAKADRKELFRRGVALLGGVSSEMLTDERVAEFHALAKAMCRESIRK